MRSRSRPERSATQNSPSSVASIQPTGPAYQPRSRPSSSLDQLDRRAARLAADRRGRVQQPGQLDRRARVGELGLDRRRQVLDVGDAHDRGLLLGLDPDRVRPQRARDAAGDDLVLLADLGAVQHLLAEVVVHRGVGAAPRRAGQRDGRGDRAPAADQQLRAGADEGGLGGADAEAEARREELAQRSQDRPGIVGGGRADRDLAGQHQLLQLPRRDPLDRRRRRPARSGWGGRGASMRAAPVGAGSSGPSGRLAQALEPAPSPLHGIAGIVRAARRSRSGSASSPRRCAAATAPATPSAPGAARTTAASLRRPARRRIPRSRPGPAPAGRPGGASIAASRSSSEQSRATSPKRSGPRETTSCALPRAPSAKPSRSGCSQQNQRSDASREASTAPLTSVGSTATVALASVRRPCEPASLDRRRRRRRAGPPSPAVIAAPSYRAWRAGSRPRPCAPSRSGRAGGSCARRPRSCRRCR